jgi:serine O-acetyltransferase
MARDFSMQPEELVAAPHQPPFERLQAPLSQTAAGDALWDHLRKEADETLSREPALTTLLVYPILNRFSFEDAIVHCLAARLSDSVMPAGLIIDAFTQAVSSDPDIGAACRADLAAIVERDPACNRLIEPLLYFKGFHAIETYRFSHWLWENGQTDFALYIQSRSSQAFQTDIHPAARIGRGVFLDHATGLVVGETAVIDNDVSILQDVTLGGTGKETGDRHPKVRSGVMIGAGAKILGNIEIGNCARVASGSVVLQAVPRNSTVAGVPAKVIGTHSCGEPAREMDQILSRVAYDSFNYVI